MSAYVTDKLAGVAKAMGGTRIESSPRKGPYTVVPYQTTHNTGGAVTGDSPETSVVNKFGQCWDVPNVFVYGASLFPQNAGINPTGTVGALTYFSIDTIKSHYLKNPGPLVPV